MLIWTLRLAIAAITFFAFRKGGEPEKFVAAVFLGSTAIDLCNHAMFGDPVYYLVNPGHLVIDAWAMIALMWIALRANRGWPMWVCAAQIIVVLGHVSKIVELSLVRNGYFAMTEVPFVIQVVALLIGTVAHLRRQERIGNYNGWRIDGNWTQSHSL